MTQISSMFGFPPGMGQVIETFEQAFMWGPYPRYWTGGYIAASAIDVGNTPTYDLRKGLVMGRQVATGQWANYNPNATDGTEVASGVLTESLRMQDVLSGINRPRFYAIMVTGGVQAAKLIGLDNMARAQLDKLFYFDDNLVGRGEFPWQRFQTKTAGYAIQPSDNLSHFDNNGATATVTFTLPPILNGYYLGFHNFVAFNLAVTSFEGGNILAPNNASANTLTLSTPGQQIGSGFYLYTGSQANKWYMDTTGPGTITVS